MAVPVWAGCTPDEVKLRGSWGQARFTVELADDASERAQGLMHRESLPRSAGMLFAYETPSEVSFWMRNTLIPLDLLFVDETGQVNHIHSEAQPLDETLIPSNGKALAVLEINGGLAAQYGITVGSEMQHQVFDQAGAVWPCER
ncbi:DUF192 domain-containing protein [Lentibacter sp. XHP0401]|uniref:DUF192 domain-containing protein n=1 Tax=Lentibacter sp. XHP0401 TaxID=2984334 RepID=UPI0021E8A8A2|nr:DUF192 domain-containing protein [Lentibacter sp. XHP0401]MCV2892172.1 DUF192 domain-containing protein [Lentibacter sp. XHP0401]